MVVMETLMVSLRKKIYRNTHKPVTLKSLNAFCSILDICEFCRSTKTAVNLLNANDGKVPMYISFINNC